MSLDTSATISAKYIALAFFTPVAGRPKWFKCNECGEDKKEGTSYTNRASHARRHAEAFAKVAKEYEDAKARGGANTLDRYIVISTYHQHIFRWLEAVVTMFIPVYEVGTETMRNFSRLNSICPNTLLKYMRVLYHGVRDHIKTILPELFGIEFDTSKMGPGFSATAVFALFMNQKTRQPDRALLGMNELLDNTNATAQNYVDTISEIVTTFGKSADNIGFTVGDNCNSNILVGKLAEAPLIGCASHQFDSALQNVILEGHEDLIKQVSSVMSELNVPLTRTQLESYTNVRPQTLCAVRFRSAISMVACYLKLAPILEMHAFEIGGHALVALVLNPVEKLRLQQLHAALQKCDAMVLLLQKESLSVGDVYLAKAALMKELEEYPGLSKYLSPNGAGIPNNELVEAIALMQLERYTELTPRHLTLLEKLAGLTLPAPTVDKPVLVGAAARHQPKRPVNFLSVAIKEGKKVAVGATYADKFSGLACIPPTSNGCERLFALAKFIHSDRRKCMHADTLEMLVFLHANRKFWKIDMILGITIPDEIEEVDDVEYLY